MTPAELVERLDVIGWFEGLPAHERSRLLEAARGRDLTDPQQVAAAVANLVISLDGVCDAATYRGFLGEIAEQVPFAFHPEAIEVTESEEEEGEIRIQLDFGDRSYRCVFDQEDDWADASILEFIAGILEHRSALRLFELPVDDAEAHLVVCPPEAFARAVAAGLVPEVPQADDED